MSLFVIACGGTGGHLAPGIALAEWLQTRAHRTLLLISDKGIDARLAAKYPDMRFAVIPGVPLLFTIGGLARFCYHQLRGLWFSWRLIRQHRPVAIVGFGGFTTSCIILAGWVRGVPVALHEANRVVGRAVRVLSPFANRIYLPPGITVVQARRDKQRPAGLPVRREIQRGPRLEAARAFQLDATKPTLVVLGGSQGARSLNQWAEPASVRLAEKGIQSLVVTGPDKGDRQCQIRPGPAGESITTVAIPFCDDMAQLYSVADLVISRAGAGTMAELIKCQVPAVLVPYPHAADNHQEGNAAWFAQGGGGVVVPDAQLAGLSDLVEDLIGDEARLADLRANLAAMARGGALNSMFADLEMVAGLPSPNGPAAPRGGREQ